MRFSGGLLHLLLLLALAPLTGCAESTPARSGESAFVSVREVRVSGVTYRVNRKSGTANRFVVATSGGSRGSKQGAATAVIRAYNCQRVSLKPTDSTWREAEGRGSFCDDHREWQPLR